MSENSRSAMHPCPFCGCQVARPHRLNDKTGWAVRCSKCGARGSLQGSMRQAIEAWNMRLGEGKE